MILLACTPLVGQQKKQTTQGTKDTPAPIPLEIKGDRIGESIEQFTAHFPKAECENKSPEIRNCFQSEGFSVAGLTDMAGTCHPPTTSYWHAVCQMISLGATFEKGKLTSLGYNFWVNGAENSEESSTRATCDAFAVKYGKPFYQNKDVCMWTYESQDGDTEQILSVETHRSKVGGQLAVFTYVQLFAARPSKDI
jgi:hypothetical protein